MVFSCAAFGCSNTSLTKECEGKKISFHGFPLKKPDILREWLEQLQRKDFNPTKHSVLCSDHFEEKCFELQNFTGRRQLKPGAIPVIFCHRGGSKRKRSSYEIGASGDAEAAVKLKDVSSQANVVDIEGLETRIKSQAATIQNLQEKLSSQDFSFNNLEDKEIKTLTGFTINTFLSIFNFLCLGDSLKDGCRLNPINQFFLFMIRIRKGLSESVLGIMFKIDQSTVNRTFAQCLGAIHSKVKPLNIWPSQHQVKAYMPPFFHKNFPACRVIIDCTEFYWQQSKNPYNQQCSFSNYKNHNTLKSLIGMAPNGSITFISDLWLGGISDIELTRRSGLLEKLEPGDVILADRGFTKMQPDFEKKNVTLATPHFLQNKIQFPIDERAENKMVSSHRCHVERVIGRIKHFKILDGTIPMSLQNIQEIYYVCCFFCNFYEQPLISPISS